MTGKTRTMERSYYLKNSFSVCLVLVSFFLPCSLQAALNTADTVLMCIHKIQPVVWVYTCHFTLVQEQSPKMLAWFSNLSGMWGWFLSRWTVFLQARVWISCAGLAGIKEKKRKQTWKCSTESHACKIPCIQKLQVERRPTATCKLLKANSET